MSKSLIPLAALALLAGAPTFAGPGEGQSGAQHQRRDRSKRDAKQTVKRDKSPPAKGSRKSDGASRQSAPTARPQESRPTARPPAAQPSQPAQPSQVIQPSQSDSLGQRGQPSTPDSAYKPSATQRAPQELSGALAQSRAPLQSAARAPQPTRVSAAKPSVYVSAANYSIQQRARGLDHRYAHPRPAYIGLHIAPHAHYRVPGRWWYRPYYTRWWVHPWWRWRYATVAVVNFTFAVNPWVVAWVPPSRIGFYWVPGASYYGVWQPGSWAPEVASNDGAPEGYVWVPGWWEGEVYVEGYWRLEYRSDGDWMWVDGRYLDDGSYARAHWRPVGEGPEGYIWEPGFWDGENLVDGFWRPRGRAGFSWVDAYYDEDGLLNTGYWYPLDELEGQVWIPGWFDGNEWTAGYWVEEAEYRDADIEGWQPDEGWDAGWDDTPAEDIEEAPTLLALPVDYPI